MGNDRMKSLLAGIGLAGLITVALSSPGITQGASG